MMVYTGQAGECVFVPVVCQGQVSLIYVGHEVLTAKLFNACIIVVF